MKYYYVFNGVPRIEDRTHPPKEAYAIVPESLKDEEAQWLIMQDNVIIFKEPVFDVDGNGDQILDVDGNPVQSVDTNGDPVFIDVPYVSGKEVVVNAALKAIKLAEKQAKKDADDADKLTKGSKKAALKALKKADIKDINGVAQILIDIIKELGL